MPATHDFSHTKLPRDPLVEKAYGLMRAALGDTPQAARTLQAAETYAQSAAQPEWTTLAALLVCNPAYLQAEKELGAGVRRRAEEVMRLIGEDAEEKPADAATADVMLARVVLHASLTQDQINGASDYIYAMMLGRLSHLRDFCTAAAQVSQSPAMAAAAGAALDGAEAALAQRVAEARAATAFALTGLPSHPLIEKAWALVRDRAQLHRPHDSLAAAFEREVAWQVHISGLPADPEVIAAALLYHSYSFDDEELARDFSPRVLALYQNSSPIGRFLPEPDDLTPQDRAAIAAIRTAGAMTAIKALLHDHRQHADEMSPSDRDDLEDEIRRQSRELSSFTLGGLLPPLLEDAARRLSHAALEEVSAARRQAAAQAAVQAPKGP